MSHKIREGDPAPDFTLPDANGVPVRLSDVYAKGPVVIYFYPKDETAGCTAQACAFRDAYQDFTDAGATVVGVSIDDPDSHQGFASHHRLPFTLLSDPDAKVHAQYGVPRAFTLLAGRVTFVIDRKGLVRLVFDSRIRMGAHAQESLAAVRRLVSTTPA
jgi:peroxiredoxin Q/BCP